MVQKWYYVAVERYDKDGNRTARRFVNGCAFGGLYSFTTDVSEAKLFGSLKGAKAYMKNYVKPTLENVLYETYYG